MNQWNVIDFRKMSDRTTMLHAGEFNDMRTMFRTKAQKQQQKQSGKFWKIYNNEQKIKFNKK